MLCSSLDEKPQGKLSLGRFRHRWEDNIIMNFKDIDVDWIHMGDGRDQCVALVNTVITLWVSEKGNILTS
jgi:hypothetical protein